MHDSSHLIFDIRLIRLDVWHDEPGGRDAGTICGYSPAPVRKRIWWTLQHRRDLHFRFWPYLRIHRWITHRCADCGRRFLWKDARHSYEGTDKVWHAACMTLRGVRSDLNDLTAHVRGTDDWNTNWRAKYRLERLAEQERMTTEAKPSAGGEGR